MDSNTPTERDESSSLMNSWQRWFGNRPSPVQILTILALVFAKLKTVLWYRRILKSIGPGTILMDPEIIGDGRCIEIGRHVFVRSRARIETVVRYAGVSKHPRLQIGDFTNIEQDAHIVCGGELRIGKHVSITARCSIVDVDHYAHYDPERPEDRERIDVTPVTIGDYAFIGIGSVILPGSNIGEHCVIGANSVVRGILPPNTIWVGAPARCVRRWDERARMWVRVSGRPTIEESTPGGATL